MVDEPELVVYKGIFKLASEPRGVARSAALAAAEMVLVSLYKAVLMSFHVLMHTLLFSVVPTTFLS